MAVLTWVLTAWEERVGRRASAKAGTAAGCPWSQQGKRFLVARPWDRKQGWQMMRVSHKQRMD